MNNLIEVILELTYLRNSKYRDIKINYNSLDDIIKPNFNNKIFAICLKKTDCYIKEDIIIELTDLSKFKYNNVEEYNEVIDDMFEFDTDIKIDVDKYTFLSVNKYDELLIDFEKDFNDIVKIYNSLNTNDKINFINNNILAPKNVLFKLQTTYFEMLSSPRNSNVKKYLKDNNLKINYENLLL